MNGKGLFVVCGVALSCFGTPVQADQGSQDPFVGFQQRFGGNQEFVCTEKGGKKLFVNVGVPQADADQMKTVPREALGNVLSVYLSRGEGKAIDASWGTPQFDQSMKFMSLRLQNGKTLVFDRFRNIPDPDADEKHFDRKAYFNLTIDNAAKLSCSQVFNLP
ncbi:hypothetical protein BLA23254_06420 [Burkholderia lata]|uniref:Lipoprotein n=1 Tax=Burkholderia lata (strain ATCC 17760 / DSM 23089 / LMG 22485 / NCIMB 9086 / R18194 / 383) TaxID=482957 RepID=A0A6P2RPZ4_BURL3|nr:hypothetical protein [Burkholderia lata]VWC32214.1 hypothetical protein BLA23254_06420 [Burkholderia lata]